MESLQEVVDHVFRLVHVHGRCVRDSPVIRLETRCVA